LVTTGPPDAVALFEQDAIACGLLITDRTLPNLTGFEIIKFAKSKRPDLPCILCSASADPRDAGGCPAIDVSAYMPKPIDAPRNNLWRLKCSSQ
jgi:CheY-like chemotaxis protein